MKKIKKMKVMSFVLIAVLTGALLISCSAVQNAEQSSAMEDAKQDSALENTEQSSVTESTSEQTKSEDSQESFVAVDDATGITVRQWIGSFDSCAQAENGLVEPSGFVLDDEQGVCGVTFYAVMEDYPDDFEPGNATYEEMVSYQSIYSSPSILFSVRQDLAKEDLQKIVDQYGDGYTLTAFQTESGLTMYQIDSDESTGAAVAEHASAETKTIMAALQGEWEQQRTQFDYTEYESTTGVTFQTVDYDGNTVDESVFGNAELTMVNVWGLTCSYCIAEMPQLQELNDELDNVQIITLLNDVRDLQDEDAVEEAHDIMETQGVTLPVLLGTDELDQIFKVTGTPTSYLVDRNGIIVCRPKVGADTKENYAKWIQEALEN